MKENEKLPFPSFLRSWNKWFWEKAWRWWLLHFLELPVLLVISVPLALIGAVIGVFVEWGYGLEMRAKYLENPENFENPVLWSDE